MKTPPKLKTFIDETNWTFAKTYSQTWPHEYIVRDRVNEALFLSLVKHIRKYGYEGRFYQKPITFFDENGMVYWTMGEPLTQTIIVNRCTKEQTYEYRLKQGTLPVSRGDADPVPGSFCSFHTNSSNHENQSLGGMEEFERR